jgi:hypothetical protein
MVNGYGIKIVIIIKIKDISSYLKNIKIEDYYTLIKKALIYTNKNIKEKFIYNWDLKDDIANFSIKLEISNSNDNIQNKFQYLLVNIELHSVKSENKKKVYQLIYEDTANEYLKMKNENEFLLETNDKLQKEQNEFSKQMDVIINDKKKLEEVYLLKFRELLNEKKRKIKNLMLALKGKEEIINEYKKINQNTFNNDEIKTNNNIDNSNKKEGHINDQKMKELDIDTKNIRKRKRSNNSLNSNVDELLKNENKMDIDSKEPSSKINNNNSIKGISNNILLNSNDHNETKNNIIDNDNNNNNNNNNNNVSDTDTDSDFNAFSLIPNIEVRSYTGSYKMPTLSSSIDLYNTSTPTEANKENRKNTEENKNSTKEDESTTDDDIDKLLDLI